MGEKPFSAVATVPENDIWQTAIHRERKLYTHENDKREAFERDFTRILRYSLTHTTTIFAHGWSMFSMLHLSVIPLLTHSV